MSPSRFQRLPHPWTVRHARMATTLHSIEVEPPGCAINAFKNGVIASPYLVRPMLEAHT